MKPIWLLNNLSLCLKKLDHYIPFKLTVTQKARKVRKREVLRGLSYGNKTALKTYLRTSPSESKMRQNHP
jgi:hypothetical protein